MTACSSPVTCRWRRALGSFGEPLNGGGFGPSIFPTFYPNNS
jgi:hypothetical protein